MAEKLGDAVLELRTDSTQLDAGISDAKGKAEGLATNFEALGQRMVGIGSKLSIGLTAPLILFSKEAITTASDAAELQSAFDVTFGAMSGTMNKWAETTGDAMGRSTQEIQRGANMFGLFFNQAAPTKAAAAEMSQSFTVLAQDLSSFFNVDPSVALEKLRSGLSGETEPLRDFGIFLTEAAVKAKAFEMGLVSASGELTEQNKVMARAALIMESTKNAQGDVARTSEGTANQIRKSKAAYEELQVAIGTKLLPVITPLITKAGDLLDGFSKLPGPVQTGIVAFLGLAAVVGPLMIGIGGLLGPIGGLITVFKGFKAAADVAGALKNVIPVLGTLGKALLTLAMNPVFLTIAALVAGIYLAWANWDKIKPIIDSVGKAISDWWNATVKPVLDTVGAAITKLVDIFTNTFGAQIKAVVALVSALLKGDFAGAWEAAKALVIATVKGWIAVLDTLVPGARAAVAKLIAGFGAWFGDLATKMLTFGREIINGLVRGILAAPQAVWNALKSVVMSGITKIKDFLGIKSPSRLFMEMGGFITEGLAIGIRNGIGEVSAAMDELAAAIAERSTGDIPGPQIGDPAEAPEFGSDDPTVPSDETQTQWRDGFRQWFKDGIKAALDGDLGGFLSNWISGIGERALDSLADELADLLSGLITGLLGGGGGSGDGIGGLVAGLGGLLGGLFGGGGVSSGTEGLGDGIASFAGMFATGGTIPLGQWGIAGENGPEPVMATARGTVVRPTRALGERLGQAGPSVSISIPIDATGADPAALERVRGEIARMERDLPGRIVSTVREASDRMMLR